MYEFISDTLSSSQYLWQRKEWPNWIYDFSQLQEPLSKVEQQQQVLFDRLALIGMHQQDILTLEAITNEVRQSSAIEGVNLDTDSVRSSVARHLGVDIGGLARSDRNVDGVVEMVLDATTHCDMPLTEDRLYGWHAALFPTGFSGILPVNVGQWRTGPMRVVSGAYGHNKVHYEAPPAAQLPHEMDCFLNWVNSQSTEHPILRASIAHLWFVTIHPFEDGNGRIARAIGDMMLARADGQRQRCYSFSAQVQRDRMNYYKILEKTQKGDMDVTAWMEWFVKSLGEAILHAQKKIEVTLQRAQCWQNWERFSLNERQKKVLGRMLEDFRGYMRPQKWEKLTKCSSDQAIEDIAFLEKVGIFRVAPNSGKKPGYEIVYPETLLNTTNDIYHRADSEKAHDTDVQNIERPRPSGPGGW